MNEEAPGMLAPLRRRPFRLLFTGGLVSNLGDWLDSLAVIVLIAYTWHLGPGYLAALAICVALPWVVIAPFAGVLADRWPKRPVLIGTDLLRAVIVTAFIFAPTIWALLPLIFLKTAVSTLFNPAEMATVRATVPDEELMPANSLAQLSAQGTKIVGPAIGGLIVGISSPRVAFGIDAATFLISAAILSRLPAIEFPAGDEEAAEEDEEVIEGFWNELRAGLSFIVQRRSLLLAIESICGAMFLITAFDTLSPLALKEVGVDRSLFGLVLAGVGFGAVVGSIVIGQFAARANPFTLMGGGEIGIGALVAVIGIAAANGFDSAPAVWIPVVVVIGFCAAGVMIPFPTILQLETPPHLMGRVSATAGSLPTAFQLMAPVLGAALAAWQGVGFVFAVAGGALAVLGAVVFIFGVRSAAQEAPEAVPAPGVGGPEPEVVGFIFEGKEPTPIPLSAPAWEAGFTTTSPWRHF